MSWLKNLGKALSVGKLVISVLDAKGVNVHGVPIGTLENAIEKAAKQAATEIKAGQHGKTGD